MRMVVQRVKEAKVTVDNQTVGQIQRGLLILLAIHKDDTVKNIEWMVNKAVNLRIFSDEQGKMNHSVKDIHGEALVVSQFTLYANCKSGNRPDFLESAKGPDAEALYLQFVANLKQKLGRVETGKFGAMMDISLVNEGPVTVLVDSL